MKEELCKVSKKTMIREGNNAEYLREKYPHLKILTSAAVIIFIDQLDPPFII